MTRHRARAIMLSNLLVVVVCIGILGNLAAFVLNRALILQKGAVAWSSDDAIVDSLIRSLRRDAGGANTALLDESGTLVLHNTRTGAKVRYAQARDVITRSANPPIASERQKTWSLRRSTLRWTIERTGKHTALVWTTVQIRETRPPNRRQAPRVLNHYAVALRVGSEAPQENRP
ncbi:MAG: hypothetical protein JXQ73_26360 [Phycisphaerae bacterium]|nr:hypothetical protein [Phycisphaerae bacterium]